MQHPGGAGPCKQSSASSLPSFSADSDQEKEEWVEAMQHAIAEALSNSEVAERIWATESNRFCADCEAPQPDWASINLCVVICKRCAGSTCRSGMGTGTGRGRGSPGCPLRGWDPPRAAEIPLTLCATCWPRSGVIWVGGT